MSICAFCARGDHYACRKDIHPCSCPEDRCNLPGTDEPEPPEEEYERFELERLGFYDLSLPVEDFNEQIERLDQIVPDRCKPLYLHPSFGLR